MARQRHRSSDHVSKLKSNTHYIRNERTTPRSSVTQIKICKSKDRKAQQSFAERLRKNIASIRKRMNKDLGTSLSSKPYIQVPRTPSSIPSTIGAHVKKQQINVSRKNRSSGTRDSYNMSRSTSCPGVLKGPSSMDRVYVYYPYVYSDLQSNKRTATPRDDSIDDSKGRYDEHHWKRTRNVTSKIHPRNIRLVHSNEYFVCENILMPCSFPGYLSSRHTNIDDIVLYPIARISSRKCENMQNEKYVSSPYIFYEEKRTRRLRKLDGSNQSYFNSNKKCQSDKKVNRKKKKSSIQQVYKTEKCRKSTAEAINKSDIRKSQNDIKVRKDNKIKKTYTDIDDRYRTSKYD